MEVEEKAVIVLRVQEEVVELERRVGRLESGYDGPWSASFCSDASGKAIKFGLTPCGLLEIFNKQDETSGKCTTDDGNKCF